MPLVPGSDRSIRIRSGCSWIAFGDRVAAVDGFVDHLVLGMGPEQRLQPVAQQRMIVDNEDAMAHGFVGGGDDGGGI